MSDNRVKNILNRLGIEETGKYERTYDYKLVYNGITGKYERYFYNNEEFAFNVPASTKFASVERKTLSAYDYQANNHGDNALTQEAYEMFVNYLFYKINNQIKESEVFEEHNLYVREKYFNVKALPLMHMFEW